MAEAFTPKERLQPSLLDRLTDDKPGSRTEPRDAWVLSKARLRQAVLRDLEWLFSTTRLETGTSMAGFPSARRSVVNFGLPTLSGRTASAEDRGDLARAIRQAILDFEPRILPQTLQVKALETGEGDHHHVIGVEIHGQLWAQPVPLELLLRTEIELETGKVEIVDEAAPRVD